MAHYKKKPILLCMDANCHMDKSDVLQAMTRAGWAYVAGGLGDTSRSGFYEKLGEDTMEWTKWNGVATKNAATKQRTDMSHW